MLYGVADAEQTQIFASSKFEKATSVPLRTTSMPILPGFNGLVSVAVPTDWLFTEKVNALLTTEIFTVLIAPGPWPLWNSLPALIVWPSGVQGLAWLLSYL